MRAKIHSKAIVSSLAQLDSSVRVGPYAIIGNGVKIAADTIVDASAQILGRTEIGINCHIFPFAVVGNIPQDLKYKGEKSFLIIGRNNYIREFVTINTGTEENSKTVIGDNNLFMAYSHIAHDCKVGSNNVFANNATLAGYVEVQDNAGIGGLTAVHQFCRLGSFSMIGGCSKVVQDIPPYSLCDGHPAAVQGLNLVGLRRADFSSQIIKDLKKAFKIIFFDNHPFDKAMELVKKELKPSKEIDYLFKFLSSSKRGVAR